LNQYAKLYIEFIYNDGFSNGYFGDLRKYVEVKSAIDNVRGLQNLEIDFTKIKLLIDENKGEGKPIKEVYIKKQTDINF
jgi:CRISPR-associated protein Csh2